MNRFAALDIDEFEEEPSAKSVATEAEIWERVCESERIRRQEIIDKAFPRDVDAWMKFFESSGGLSQYVISRGPPHVWRRKDGSTLLVEAMSDTHLLNSARLLLRKFEEGRTQRQVRFSLKVLKLEADHRGRLL